MYQQKKCQATDNNERYLSGYVLKYIRAGILLKCCTRFFPSTGRYYRSRSGPSHSERPRPFRAIIKASARISPEWYEIPRSAHARRLASRDGCTYIRVETGRTFISLVSSCHPGRGCASPAPTLRENRMNLVESSLFLTLSFRLPFRVSFFSASRTAHYRAAKDSRTLLAILRSRSTTKKKREKEKIDGRRVYHGAFMPPVPP